MPQGTMAYLKRGLDGVVESRVIPLDLSANLATGETITSATVTQLLETGGGGNALTLGAATVDSTGTQVQFRVSAPSGTLDGVWAVSVTATTSLGNTLIGSGGVEIVGSSGNG